MAYRTSSLPHDRGARRRLRLHALCWFGGAALMLLAAPAQADLVFRFHNTNDGSGEARKGVMQNVGIVWLRPGQAEIVRKGGYLDVNVPCVSGFTSCPPIIPRAMVANFEHLGTSSIQYCIWDISYVGGGGSYAVGGASYGVRFHVTKRYQRDGYQCDMGGQMEVPVPAGNVHSNGATLDFVVRKIQ